MSAGSQSTPADALQSFVVERGAGFATFDGSNVALPMQSGLCDPTPCLSDSARRIVSDPSLLFPSAQWSSLTPALRIGIGKPDYARLVWTMVANGKVSLMRHPAAAASVFAIPKKGSTNLREIWAGQHISALSARPPAPPRLGNPGVFSRIVRAPHAQLWFSKRDARAFFDQLRLPSQIRPYFGRPAVTLRDLALASGLPLSVLAESIVDLEGGEDLSNLTVTPVSNVWPMGFSWSSFVAQSFLVQIALDAGIPVEAILSLDVPHPTSQHELVTLATDDAIFIHQDRPRALATLMAFDAALESHGVERSMQKDTDLACHISALGCSLSDDPPLVEADSEKLGRLLRAVLALPDGAVTPPSQIESMLGVAQWFAQIPRWHLSIFNEVYKARSTTLPDNPVALPPGAALEFHIFLALAPLLAADMSRPFSDLVTCSDASTSFGFGVSVAACSPSTIEALSSKSERHGHYLEVLDPEPGARDQRRKGLPIRLPLRRNEFKKAFGPKGLLIREAWRLTLRCSWCSGCYAV